MSPTAWCLKAQGPLCLMLSKKHIVVTSKSCAWGSWVSAEAGAQAEHLHTGHLFCTSGTGRTHQQGGACFPGPCVVAGAAPAWGVGVTSTPAWWPGHLLHCIQSHVLCNPQVLSWAWLLEELSDSLGVKYEEHCLGRGFLGLIMGQREDAVVRGNRQIQNN